ncbi:MAG TPA: biotin/lipoyl-binding protein, partial [Candidatus Angelobacter sp.]
MLEETGMFMSIQSQTQIKAPPYQPAAPSMVKAPRSGKRSWLTTCVVLLVFGGIVVYGLLTRLSAGNTVRAETAQMAVPSVSVVSPQHTAPAQEIVLPGNVQPFISSPIYARTSGYVKNWYADIGSHVRKGQLLAVIETPEVDQQLAQSRSNLATAQANLKLA